MQEIQSVLFVQIRNICAAVLDLHKSCAHPIELFWTGNYTKNGKREFSVKRTPHSSINSIKVPCGHCVFCQMRRKAEVGMRAVHEAAKYTHNCFITLTVADEYMNEIFPNRSLSHRPFQLFAKRLRKYISKHVDKRKIKILMCGEYGELKDRPHYHAIIFNFDFDDKIKFGKGYISKTLTTLWPYGFSSIGQVNFDSASYIAKYVVKQKDDLDYLDEDTGEIRKKEYIVYPKGLGFDAFEKYKKKWYDLGYIRNEKGFVMKIPRYYDRKLSEEDPQKFEQIRQDRITALLKLGRVDIDDLLISEQVELAKEKFLKSIRR